MILKHNRLIFILTFLLELCALNIFLDQYEEFKLGFRSGLYFPLLSLRLENSNLIDVLKRFSSITFKMKLFR